MSRDEAVREGGRELAGAMTGGRKERRTAGKEAHVWFTAASCRCEGSASEKK